VSWIAPAVAIISAMTRGAEARLFVALDLPVGVRAQLAGWARAAAASVRAQARAVAPPYAAAARGGGAAAECGRPRSSSARGHLRLLEAESMHATLCFLGNRPVGEIEAIGDALAEACAEVSPIGELALGAPLWLPPRRPRALAVELHDTPDGALSALRSAVAAALAAACELSREHRRFHPHVTVARVRPAEAPHERALPATPQLSFTPASASLQRSWLTPTEAVYEELLSCSLPASFVE
jgi:RNA 2',3'-cyclic 3'-phosphodiesterase